MLTLEEFKQNTDLLIEENKAKENNLISEFLWECEGILQKNKIEEVPPLARKFISEYDSLLKYEENLDQQKRLLMQIKE